MSLLSRFARKGASPPVPEQPAECRHRELAPRWENADDIGKKDKITYLSCVSCGESFSPLEAERRSAA
jgi:hypothetical protein